MTVINRNRDAFRFLFGDASDGSAVISSNTNLASVLNGNIVEKKYLDLTINAGAVLSVSNPCKGLILRVRGVLTLNGTISMSNRGCYVPGGAPDLFVHYDDIKIPSIGAAGGAAVAGAGGITAPNGNKGANGVNGQCGGGGSGGAGDGAVHTTGAGAGGYVFSGGTGGSGGAVASASGYDIKNGNPGLAYGQKGGDGVLASRSHDNGDGTWQTGRGRSGGGAGGVTPGAGVSGDGGSAGQAGGIGSGGILIVIANRIVGSGSILSAGAKGGNAGYQASNGGWGSAGGGGGSGGGSIVLFYGTNAFTGSMLALGGAGGTGAGIIPGGAGGAGGAGSVRDWSLVELASHTRI